MKSWPEGVKSMPGEEEVLAPLVAFVAGRLNWRRRTDKDKGGLGPEYDGFPVTAATCPPGEAPSRFFADEHGKVRAAAGLPCVNLLELVLYAAFRLGVEYANRSNRAPVNVAGGVGGKSARSLQRDAQRAANRRERGAGRQYY